jgi:uridine kinase
MKDFYLMNKEQRYLIGIAGASGSGKSYFAKKLQESLAPKKVFVLSQDFYYKDNSEIPLEERARINYDHPEAIDFDLLQKHLLRLKKGKSIKHPLYNFKIHNREEESVPAGPVDIVLLDGILIYAVANLMDLFDYKVYIDTPMDICFIRRMQRDTLERGRTIESVIHQYINTVRPMFLKFVLPSMNQADMVIKGQGDVIEKVNQVIEQIT